MSGKRQKLPVGAGGYFVLTPSTLRFQIDAATDGRIVAELLVNTNGDGAIVLVPPGVKFAPGIAASKMGPLEAVELLRRVNLYRLANGRPEHRIPAALIRRAKAEQLPGIEALVPFPGRLKTFYEGRGSWEGAGLWVSADGEYSLEMRAPVGVLRKSLTELEAKLWLDANGHKAWDEPHGRGTAPDREPDQWRIATAGHQAEGGRAFWAVSWGTGEPLAEDPVADIRAKKAAAAKDAKLRDVVKRARSIAPPLISPPRKAPRPRRRK
jgi:hypothetical protein